MRSWVVWWSGTLLLACQTLPSALPLADTGGNVPSAVRADRDGHRRADASDEGAAGAGVMDEIVVKADDPKPAETLPDAGTPAVLPTAPSSTDAVVRWPGEYVGSDRLVRKFDEGPEDVQLDDKARTRVEQPNPTALVISIINSSNGDVICALRASVSGNRATVEAGQTCFGEEDSGARISKGNATLDGDRLVVEFEGSIEESDEDIAEHDSYHFDGTRR